MPPYSRNASVGEAFRAQTIVVAMLGSGPGARPARFACAGLATALAALALGATEASAGWVATAPRVVIAFLPATEQTPLPENAPESLKEARKRAAEQRSVLNRLARRTQLALGFLGATQGPYSREQFLLDVTQGTRVARAAYDPRDPPNLGLVLSRSGGYLRGWGAARRRAESARARLVPGLLAESIPGGIGWAGVHGRTPIEAIAAANRRGHVAAVSLGSSDTVARRARALLERRQAVVVSLPPGAEGVARLDELLRARVPNELLIAIKAPPDRNAPQLLPMGVVGLGPAGEITSTTTRRGGIVAAIDLLPTVLDHLEIDVPGRVKGQTVRIEGARDPEGLRQLERRLRVVNSRRIPALQVLLVAWLGLIAVLRLRRGRPGMRLALRVGALGILWSPAVLLLTAALAPTRRAEQALVALTCLALGALTDRFARWPRGPLVPAVVGLGAYAIDLVNHSELIVRSLLGPNPRFGARYYGLGNELESTLPVLLLVGIAAGLTRCRDGRVVGGGRSARAAWTFAVLSLVLGAVVGSGRLGADVGGVVTVGAAGAVATVLMLPGGPTRRAIAIACLVPGLALVALAVLDLATGGDSHFTRTVLRAEGGSDVLEVLERRYVLAWNQLQRGLMPLFTVAAVVGVVQGVRHRRRVLAPLEGAPAWEAALGGSLAGGLVGALANDSGPLLLVFSAFTVAFVTLYLRGDPRRDSTEPQPAARPRPARAGPGWLPGRARASGGVGR